MDHVALEYYADIFEQRGYGRYLTLPQFLNSPEQWMETFDCGGRPLLPAQRDLQERIDATSELDYLLDKTGEMVARLEREVERLPQRNGAPIEPFKHHRNTR